MFEQQDFVEQSLWLWVYGCFYLEQIWIKVGEYEFIIGMMLLDMLMVMVIGDIKYWLVQFIEGWIFSDMWVVLV